jgi:hypothetical protein
MSEVYSLKLDPTGHYEGVPQKGLHASLGLISTLCHSVSLSTPKDVQEAYDLLQDEYGFGMGSDGDPEEWGTVTEDGTYVSKYPEDSDLYPLAVPVPVRHHCCHRRD